MFELITDCLVCMGSFFLRFGFCFGFLRRVHICAGSCAKAGRPSQTRHGCAVFLIASGRVAKNPLAVLEFAASSSSHDDAYPRAKKTMPDAGELKESRVVGA
jgi:hypothetical protein